MKATRAWHKHHQEGKTDAVTGRFFRPRVSEEFYDTVDDFDNVKNLIGASEHQDKIAELKAALRKKQLELFDSGLLPEDMRVPKVKIGPACIGNWSEPKRDDPHFAVRNLNGSMDEFAIFSAVLSAGEIRNIFRNGKP